MNIVSKYVYHGSNLLFLGVLSNHVVTDASRSGEVAWGEARSGRPNLRQELQTETTRGQEREVEHDAPRGQVGVFASCIATASTTGVKR